MRIIILTAFFVTVLSANEESKEKVTTSTADDKNQSETLETIPTSYDFKYSTGQEGPAQLFREEHRDHDGTVRGKYGYVDPNGKLRVIEYRAGAKGYSASGDIGPDKTVIDEAQQWQSNDPSVRAQADAWRRQSSANYGTNTWNSPPVGWSSVNPLWNVGALQQSTQLPQSPDTQQQQPLRSSPPSPSRGAARPILQPAVTRPLPPVSGSQKSIPSSAPIAGDQVWDDRTQSQWDNTNRNSYQRSDQKVDWNTWNADQQTWSKPTTGSGAGHQWTSTVDHNLPNAPAGQVPTGVSPFQPSPQWQSPQSPALDQWVPPSQGPTAGRWSPSPQSPTAGQWSTQLDEKPVINDWSGQQPVQPLQPEQQPIQQPIGQSIPSQPDINDLRQRWTGTPAENPTQQQWDQPVEGPPSQSYIRPAVPKPKPLPPPPAAGQWTPAQPQSHSQWSDPIVSPPSIADQWSQRQTPQTPREPVSGVQYVREVPPARTQAAQPSPVSWQTAFQHEAHPVAPQQWQPQSQIKTSRVGEQPPQSVPTIPQDPVPTWSKPAKNIRVQPRQPNPVPKTTANIGSGQQWADPPLLNSPEFSGPAFVSFRIDHTVPNEPPLRYQYSY